MTREQSVRAASFDADLLLWLPVRHFLSAGLLRELCAAVVRYGADGAFALDDLFVSIETGDGSFGVWALEPRSVEGGLAQGLQNLVRSVAWQGDSMLSLDAYTLEDPEKHRLEALAWAVDAGRMDFGSVSHAERRTDPPEMLLPFIEALRSYHSTSEPGTHEYANSSTVELLAGSPYPVGAVLIKHLGDLCADADDWEAALGLYEASGTLLPEAAEQSWQEFRKAMIAIIRQSQASALRTLQGGEAALAVLSPLQRLALAEAPVAVINGAADLSSAALAARDFSQARDSRTAVVVAPQLLTTHRHFANAYQQLADSSFRDANRWFWAGLRRQTAFGSHVYGLQAKAAFGQALIIQCVDSGQRSTQETFSLGVKLMVESGQAKVAERAPWSPEMVAHNVDPELIERVKNHIRGGRDTVDGRASVALEMFGRWTRLLPRDRVAEATAMLQEIVKYADPTRGPGSRQNLSYKALKALRAVSREKPDFRSLIAQKLADLALRQMETTSGFLLADVVETVASYSDGLTDEDLTRVLNQVAEIIENVDPAGLDYNYVNAIHILVRSANANHLRASDPDLNDRLSRLELRIAIAQGSDAPVLFFLLRRLPADLTNEVDRSVIANLVKQARRRALEINSSGADDNIVALLSVPEIVGDDGLTDALTGLRNILREASAGGVSISFGSAYRALLVISDPAEPSCAKVVGDSFSGHALVEEIWDELIQLWKAAIQTPELFNGFMLPPPTEPSAVAVHNWAFASCRFAKALGRETAMDAALSAAQANGKIARPISVGRTISTTPDTLDEIQTSDIHAEDEDVFYASLGQRLVVLAATPLEHRAGLVTALLLGCLRLGPNALDAAVFTVALEKSLDLTLQKDSLLAYRRRLSADQALRLRLSPLVYALTQEDVDDE